MPDLDEFALARLAREMAMAVRSYKDIFSDYEIDESDYYEIEKNEFYKRAKAQFAIEWNSALSAADRVKVISASYLEQMLPVLGAKATHAGTTIGDATELAKLFSRNAGIGEGKGDGKSAAERFVITINIGEDSKTYDKPLVIDGTGGEMPRDQKVLESASNREESDAPVDFFSGQ